MDLDQGYTKPGGHVAVETKFCTVARNICEFSVWNLRRVTLLVHRFLENLCPLGTEKARRRLMTQTAPKIYAAYKDGAWVPLGRCLYHSCCWDRSPIPS